MEVRIDEQAVSAAATVAVEAALKEAVGGYQAKAVASEAINDALEAMRFKEVLASKVIEQVKKIDLEKVLEAAMQELSAVLKAAVGEVAVKVCAGVIVSAQKGRWRSTEEEAKLEADAIARLREML